MKNTQHHTEGESDEYNQLQMKYCGEIKATSKDLILLFPKSSSSSSCQALLFCNVAQMKYTVGNNVTMTWKQKYCW